MENNIYTKRTSLSSWFDLHGFLNFLAIYRRQDKPDRLRIDDFSDAPSENNRAINFAVLHYEQGEF